VATRSESISVTWGGVAFTEVTDLQVSYAGGDSRGRSVEWTDDAGTVSVTCLGGTNVSSSEYAQRKSLAISGGGVTLTVNAIYQGWAAAPELNGVTRYTVSFKLLDG